MGNKNLCPKCGKPKKSHRLNRNIRKAIMASTKLPTLKFLEPTLEETKEYCDICWGKAVLPAAQGKEYDL